MSKLVPSPHGMRVAPSGLPQDLRTFSVSSPIETHTRPASCVEVECSAHRNGWRTTVVSDSADEALLRQACAGQIDGHRRFFTVIPQENGQTQFVFDAGQTCLAVTRHRIELERPALFLRRDGDWRANLGGERLYDRPDQFADDLHTHTDSIRHIKETRG